MTGGDAAKRAGIYVRVSTREQSLRPQFAALRDLCAGRGWPVVAVYRDRASGVKERPGLRRCLHDAAMRRFDVVVVWALDRFGRTTIEVLSRIERLQARGVGFVSLREAAIDTSSAAGSLIVAVMAAVASFERARLVERTREALADRKRHGVRLGPRRPGGRGSGAGAARGGRIARGGGALDGGGPEGGRGAAPYLGSDPPAPSEVRVRWTAALLVAAGAVLALVAAFVADGWEALRVTAAVELGTAAFLAVAVGAALLIVAVDP